MTGAGGERQPCQALILALIMAGKVPGFHGHRHHRSGRRHSLPLHSLLQQRPDPLPGNLGLLHGVEQFGRMAGLHCQFGETGQECSEPGNVPVRPTGALHVPGPQDEDDHRTGHGNGIIQGLHTAFKEIGPGTGLFVGGELLFIGSVPAGFLPVDPIGQGMAHPVQGQGVQLGFRSFVDAVGLDHLFFQPVGDPVGQGREAAGKQGQFPVIGHEQHQVHPHDHAGIEHFRGEFPHAFRTSVHVPHSIGHQAAQVLPLQGSGVLLHQAVIQGMAQKAAHLVGKKPGAVPLACPGHLHQQDHQHIEGCQPGHGRNRCLTLVDVVQALGQLPLEIGAGAHADVIQDAGDRDHPQHRCLQTEIGADLIRPLHFPYFPFQRPLQPLSAEGREPSRFIYQGYHN